MDFYLTAIMRGKKESVWSAFNTRKFPQKNQLEFCWNATNQKRY